jgi:hypothetical protein
MIPVRTGIKKCSAELEVVLVASRGCPIVAFLGVDTSSAHLQCAAQQLLRSAAPRPAATALQADDISELVEVALLP